MLLVFLKTSDDGISCIAATCIQVGFALLLAVGDQKVGTCKEVVAAGGKVTTDFVVFAAVGLVGVE